MAKEQVQVVKGWSGGPYGSRAKGDRFDYDFAHDPDKLRKMGLVEKVAAAAEKPAK